MAIGVAGTGDRARVKQGRPEEVSHGMNSGPPTSGEFS